MERVIKNKLVHIIQDPEMKQLIGRGKAIQMPIFINIFGDSAIEKAAAHDGDIKEAIKYILSRLPPPRWIFLRALALEATTEMLGSKKEAAKYLGVGNRTAYDKRISWVKLSEEMNDFLETDHKVDDGEPRGDY